MSKTLLVTLKQLYQIELFFVIAAAAAMVIMVGLKMYGLMQPIVLPPSANMTQLQLQNALTLINPEPSQ